MVQKDPPRRMLRSIAAVVAGVLTTVIPAVVLDAVLHATGVLPPLGERMSDPLLLLATIYRNAFGILGGYVAARLAPNRPLGHALTLGIIGLVASTAGAIATWNAGPAFEPKWYPLALVATALPSAWIGGKLLQARSPLSRDTAEAPKS